MKLCKDCAHFHEMPFSKFPLPPRIPYLQCRAPQVTETDPVYGHGIFQDARVVRGGGCGANAVWFAPIAEKQSCNKPNGFWVRLWGKA